MSTRGAERSAQLERIAEAGHRWFLEQVGDGCEPTTDELEARVHELDPLLGDREVRGVVERVQARVAGLGPLEPLLADHDVTEIMVSPPGGRVWVERQGRVVDAELAIGDDTTFHLLGRMASSIGRRIDRSSPIVDARLPDGSRVAGLIPPAAVDGPTLTIRRFAASPIPLEAFGASSAIEALVDAVRRRRTIVIAGGTSTGKTTLLNALAGTVPEHERMVTIEEAAELRIDTPQVVRLEAQRPNAEGRGEVTVTELVRASLRLRPDRLILGEVRGPEAFDLLQALNTGHEGSLTTVHANHPLGALRRLETLALTASHEWTPDAAREHVAIGVDLVAQLERRADGARCIASVTEVVRDRDGGLGTRPVAP